MSDSAANICVRLHEDEPERWTEILRRARQRKPHANKSEIARALFRFAPYKEGLLTDEDRRYFLKKGRNPSAGATEMIGRAVDMPADVREVKNKRRRSG